MNERILRQIEARYDKAMNPAGHPQIDEDLHWRADKKPRDDIPMLVAEVRRLKQAEGEKTAS